MEVERIVLKKKEIPYIFETDEGEKSFFLRELSGKGREEYLTSIQGKIKFDAKGKPAGMKSFDGLQAGLLTRCLFDEENKPISAETLMSFPASAVTLLFEKAKEINGLEEKAEENAKKDSEENGETGSN